MILSLSCFGHLDLFIKKKQSLVCVWPRTPLMAKEGHRNSCLVATHRYHYFTQESVSVPRVAEGLEKDTNRVESEKMAQIGANKVALCVVKIFEHF